MRAYLAADELHPASQAWQMHTNMFEKETVPAAIRWHYAEPESLTIAEYVVYGQMFQASLHGHAMEALRFRKDDPVDDCQGALIWSYSECWGETGWSIIDYYLRRKASYYWFRRACAPVKVIVRQRGDAAGDPPGQRHAAPSPAGGNRLVARWTAPAARRDTQPGDGAGQQHAGGGARTRCRATRRATRASGCMPPCCAGRRAAMDQCIWTLRPHRELALRGAANTASRHVPTAAGK